MGASIIKSNSKKKGNAECQWVRCVVVVVLLLVVVCVFGGRGSRIQPLRLRVSSAPLRLLVKGPQFQVELQLGIRLLPLLHCGKPVPRAVEGRPNNLKLAQSRLMDVLLLHDVQLWGREDWQSIE